MASRACFPQRELNSSFFARYHEKIDGSSSGIAACGLGFRKKESFWRQGSLDSLGTRDEMSLKVVGQHKGLISLDLANATVFDLKKAVSDASGLPVVGLKLLAGECLAASCEGVRSNGHDAGSFELCHTCT